MSSPDSAWLVALARSPLVFRSGRPFGAAGESGGADGYGFPMPATVAGAVRAAWVDACVSGAIDHAAVRARQVQGPLLAELEGATLTDWLFPTPLDAVYESRPNGAVRVVAAQPFRGSGFGCNLPNGLTPLMVGEDPQSEPCTQAESPPFWRSEAILRWLISGKGLALETPQPRSSPRRHVGLQTGRKVADEGRLFQSAGLAFGPFMNGRGWSERRLAVAVRVSKDTAQSVDGRVARMGADGRSVRYRSHGDGPHMAQELALALGQLRKGYIFRLLLATPGVFESGWHPDWLSPKGEAALLQGPLAGFGGVPVCLRAAALERWQVHSGWQMEPGKRGPKASRRVVPAGAVYWLELLEDPRPGELQALWLRSLASQEQDIRDGWALGLPGLAFEQPKYAGEA